MAALFRIRLLSGLFLALALVAGCTRSTTPVADKKPVEVVVTSPIQDEVIDYQDFTGRLEALQNVEIRARVSGFVTEARFKEGDMVHKGDLLFQIDPKPYEVGLKQAEANLKLAQAERNVQGRHAERARQMVSSRSMARDDYDSAMAALEKAEATVGAMEANRDMSQIHLDYTHVKTPLSGRVSRRFVDPGNLVTQDVTLLTTVMDDEHLYAYFDVDERTYLMLVGGSSQGDKWLSESRFPVFMRLANEESFSRKGIVNFVDNHVNPNTGTIRIRAVFDNPKKILKPGLFVRVRLPIGSSYKAILVPDEALMSDQGRKYVYIVNEKNEVVYRPVTMGQELQSLRVIKEGLTPTDRVIVNGMQRVRRGAEVQPKPQDPPKAPSATLARLLKGDNAESDKHAAD